MSKLIYFSTPVWTFQINNYENVNEEMYNYIKSEQKKDGRITKSNIKGWHSKDFSLETKDLKFLLT